ncbi:ExeA family protein [Marinobacterium lutimaris]|uniref:Type II secretion system protein A n=1 Tax=Marinobacterium lutimaris TaxID=568106 RepID=A0A1H5WYW2_9GAMM|nr:ExeA family protein [Marinobacterium lutimaris]SEG04503.1 type II secretion system protein A [Marinobacterium lutimaris]
MYCNYFGLSESPFSIAPNPRYLFMSDQHQEALAHLLYGISIDGGFVLLTGEVGTGKTTVARQLLEQLSDQSSDVALILNPRLTVPELLETISDELGIDRSSERLTVKSQVDAIYAELLNRYAQGRKTVLLIDEAQQLSVELLEQVRLLTNLETSEHKLLNVILVGQPELLEMLAREDLRQLSQRITARFHLGPLSAQDLPLYMQHRLSVAGLNRPVFPEPVLKQLYRLSAGVPRLINLISDRALLGTYVQKQNEVTPETLKKAAAEVLGDELPLTLPAGQSKRVILAAAVVIGLMAWGTGFALSVLFQQGSVSDLSASVRSLFDDTVDEAQAEPAVVEATPVARERPITLDQLPATAAGVPATADASVVPEAMVNTSPLSDISLASLQLLQSEPAGVAQTKPSGSDVSAAAEVIWPEQQDRDLALVKAYRRLFSLWGIEYDPRQQPVVCDFAAFHDLACLTLNGDLELLKQIDRPVVARIGHDGRTYEALILSLDENLARIYLSGTELQLPTEDLESGWLGEFTLLWRPPPGYVAPIWPGAYGDEVAWLDKQLARISKQVLTTEPRKAYGPGLIALVRDFQAGHGLNVDGVAGPRTLIQMNNAALDDQPRLAGEGR